MTNRLLAIGADTIGLEFCTGDARLVSTVFERCGYQVRQAEPSQTSVQEAFFSFLDECGRADTAILYFAGHGLAEADRLFFVLDDDTSRRSNLVDLSQTLKDFGTCPANNRLVILDCCNASHAAHAHWKLAPSERHLLLGAARFLENARESSRIQGGVLTHYICASLKASARPARCVTIRSLYDEVCRGIDEHNQQYPLERAPTPVLLGQLDDFVIAEMNEGVWTRILEHLERGPSGRRELRGFCDLSQEQLNELLDDLKGSTYVGEMDGVLFLAPKGRRRLDESRNSKP